MSFLLESFFKKRGSRLNVLFLPAHFMLCVYVCVVFIASKVSKGVFVCLFVIFKVKYFFVVLDREKSTCFELSVLLEF